MASLEQLERDIKEIKDRNKKVEINKAWETSNSRKVLVMVLTYLLIVIFFFVAGLPDPWVNSIVPAVAFVISTFSLPFFKNSWIKFFHK